MTQLYINRYFQQKLEEEISRAKRYNRKVSMIMTDIDFFKKFNDTYGHQQGDLVLMTTAKLFKQCVRDVDLPCRYGGEEYCVILPETDEKRALEVAERLRKAVEDYEYPALEGNKKLKVNISAGVSTFPEHGTTVEELVKKADIALYACKESGRNCAKIYTSDMKPEEDIKTPEKK